eukprot:CAMPEP_0197439146 /NCGR_PEP_ID=MMETSP1175-20131217/5952_1 /TAXON_ID=1003142 /ORGANISM="Triceratium dubium, Strain CCMP147" /LENGTH=114 /DNA_ID=CAMNT_0042968997 /DNA_START=146 /DNA_END=490 /DNA_ORIENTATION=-
MAAAEDDLKPGQKFPTPTPGFGDRVFYETLLRQRPDSAMAQEWCVNYGVLHADEAAKVHKIVMKRKKTGNPTPSSTSKTKKTRKVGKKKRVVGDVGYDADMQTGGSEGMGTATL